MLKDVDGAVEVEEGIQRVAGGVLPLVLVADALAQHRIPLQPGLQLENAARQLRLPSVKLIIRVGQRGVDHRPRRQHELHGVQSVIGILLDAATHAAGIVGQDSAQRAGCDRCRVRPDLSAIRYQRAVGGRANDSRLHPDLLPALFYLYLTPVAGHVHQQAVGDRLSRQAGSGSAEGHGDARLLAESKERVNLLQILGLHHGLRDQPVEAGVGGAGDQLDRPDKNAILRDEAVQGQLDLFGRNLRRGDQGCCHYSSLRRLVSANKLRAGGDAMEFSAVLRLV